jgi:hypothetical protein
MRDTSVGSSFQANRVVVQKTCRRLCQVHWPAPELSRHPALRYAAGPGHVRRTRGKPLPDLLQLRGELLLRDGLALLPLVVLVPDRTPPAAFLPGRVHGDPVLQLDYFPVTPGGGAGLDAGNPARCLRLCGNQFEGAAGGLARAGCGDSVGILKTAAVACAIFASSLPAFPQVGGLTQEVWDGAGERIRTADRPLTRRMLCQLSYTGRLARVS